MKRYEFEIKDFELKTFFPHYRIKAKSEIINIILESTRFMSVNDFKLKSNSERKIVLIIDKMSRIFFFKEDKYISLSFPFSVRESSGQLFFKYQNYLEIPCLKIWMT